MFLEGSDGDLHPRLGYPGSGNGVLELVEFIDALFEVGYLSGEVRSIGPGVGFEIRPQAGETSGAIIGNLKRAWPEAWPQVKEKAAAV